jgi:type I restriction enzyme S subunit
MGNIQNGKLDCTNLKYVPYDSEHFSSYYVQLGDILFNRTNSPELVGKCAVIDDDINAIFASYLIRIKCRSDIVLSNYLSWWINSPSGRLWARFTRTDGVSQSNINASKLKSLLVPLPPIQEQHEIVHRIDALFAYADAVEAKVAAAREKTEKLRQSILAKAFSGELVPTEAELARREGRDYEPAEVLLERINEGGKAGKSKRDKD